MRWWVLHFCLLFGVVSVGADVVNGGFERITEAQAPIGWRAIGDSVSAVVERGDAHSGKAAVHLSGGTASVAQLVSDVIAVQEGALYTLIAWAKVSDGQAFARLHWLGEDETLVGESMLTTGVTALSWAQMAGSFVAPRKAAFARVICLLQGKEAVFDEVVLRKVSDMQPFGLALDAQDFGEKNERAARIRVTVQDSLGASDGAVVKFEASRGQIESWALVKDGAAEVTLHDADDQVGGVWVRAFLVNLVAKAYVGDAKAARLSGRIFDANSGRPMAGRVMVTDSTGAMLQTGFDAQGFVAYDQFAIDVLPGQVAISIVGGVGLQPPEMQVLDLVAGEEHAVDLPFRSWVDLRAQGWLGGDLFSGPEASVLAQANGLAWAALPEPIDGDDVHTVFGGAVENQWGNQWVLGAPNHLNFDKPGFEIHALAHQGRGIAGYAHLFGAFGVAGLLYDVLAGPTFDALNVVDDGAQQVWFDLLNRGYRIAGTAYLSDDFRTFTQLTGDLSTDKLVRAIANGQNMITNGPLISFSAFAAGPGSQLPVGRKRRATIRAWSAAHSDEYLTRIELVRNAEVVQRWDLDDQPRMHRVSVALEDSVDCWYLARCYGVDSLQVALTNPIYFQSDDYVAPEPVQAVVRGTIQMVDSLSVPEAQVRVVDPLGKVVLETVAREGVFQVWAPATSQIQVEAKGYQAVTKRIFDHQGIQGILREYASSEETLGSLDGLDKLSEQLQNIDMIFMLKPNGYVKR